MGYPSSKSMESMINSRSQLVTALVDPKMGLILSILLGSSSFRSISPVFPTLPYSFYLYDVVSVKKLCNCPNIYLSFFFIENFYFQLLFLLFVKVHHIVLLVEVRYFDRTLDIPFHFFGDQIHFQYFR